jgi:ferredoxin-NADP reductase
MAESEHRVKILYTEFVTHDVRSFIVEKPAGYDFEPGQATEVSIAEKGWEEERRPFTFTSHMRDPVLQLILKRYTEHDSVTKHLHELESGDTLILHDVWGTITWKGPGVFLAGGAGVTPFIAILRDLQSRGELAGNALLFSNKTHRDIILEREFRAMFDSVGGTLKFLLTREEHPGYDHGRIDRAYLEREIGNFERHFYVCGPPSFVDSMKAILSDLGAPMDSLVFEE